MGYEIVRSRLNNEEIMKAAGLILDCGDFEFGDNSFVYVAGTSSCVGYLGNDTLELIDNKESKEYIAKLREIFETFDKQ